MVKELSVSRRLRSFPNLDDIFKNVKWSKRICVDLDGVVCQYNFPKIVKDFFGIDLSSRAIFAYDLADVLGVAPFLIDKMFKEQVYGKPNLVDGALETLTGWKEQGNELIIFSNRVKYMGDDGQREWLIKWGIPFTSISDGKGAFDVHIDDMPAKLMATDSKVKLLFNQPWNQRCLNITGELWRVYSWQEIQEKVS